MFCYDFEDFIALEGSQANLRSKSAHVKVNCKYCGCSCDVRRFPVKELTIALHIFAELAGCKADLLEVMLLLLLINTENALESLYKGEWSSIVYREF